MPSRPEIALNGQSAGSACLASAIILTLVLLAYECVGHCAPYFMRMLEGKLFETRDHYRAEKKTALPKALRKA